MAEVQLRGGLVALVDDEDLQLVSGYNWRPLYKSRGRVYAVARVVEDDGRDRLVYMHRLIMNAQPNEHVDHRNGRTLDNRKSEMRIATPKQNGVNKQKYARTDGSQMASRFKGVTRHNKDTDRWRSRLFDGGVQVNLGIYDTEEEAARAYDREARRRFGEWARLNFPDEGRDECEDRPERQPAERSGADPLLEAGRHGGVHPGADEFGPGTSGAADACGHAEAADPPAGPARDREPGPVPAAAAHDGQPRRVGRDAGQLPEGDAGPF